MDQLGIQKFFQNSDEVIIRELKLYIEYLGKIHINTKSQLSRTVFLANYGSLDLYGEYMDKRFIIDHKKLKFDKKNRCTLVGISQKPDGTLVDYEWFCIYDDIFDIVQSTHQDKTSREFYIK